MTLKEGEEEPISEIFTLDSTIREIRSRPIRYLSQVRPSHSSERNLPRDSILDLSFLPFGLGKQPQSVKAPCQHQKVYVISSSSGSVSLNKFVDQLQIALLLERFRRKRAKRDGVSLSIHNFLRVATGS